MNKICKVRPSHSRCRTCMDTWEMLSGDVNQMPDCNKCFSTTEEYELILIGTGFWSGDYAMVQKNGKIAKVPLSRVYDIREKTGVQ